MLNRKTYISLSIVYAFFLNPIILGNIAPICYLLIYGIPFIYILLDINSLLKKIQNNAAFLFSFMGVMILVLCSFFIPIIQGTYDFSYVNTAMALVRKLIIITFLVMITEKRYKKLFTVELFMYYFCIGTVMYVLGTIFLLLFPALKNAWIEFLHLNSHSKKLFNSYGYAMRIGWSGFSGFRNTVDSSLSVAFILYLFFERKSIVKVNFLSFITVLLFSFLGNMFYGRSGVIVSVLCMCFMAIKCHKINIKLIFLGAIISVLAVIILIILKDKVKMVEEWFKWLSTPFINYIKTGSFNNYSTDMLFDKMIFKPSDKTILVGDGWFTDPYTGRYYMNTDSGFMRKILFWGIGMTIFTYILWLATILVMDKGVFLKLMLVLMGVIFEIKGEVYFEYIPILMVLSAFDIKKTIPDKFLEVNHAIN